MTRLACITKLASAIAAVRVNHPTRVAIDGVDGAGKTRMADELTAHLAAMGREVIRASVDGFHHPRAVRYQRGHESAEGYYLDSFDYQSLIRELLAPLGPRGTRRYRTAVFDHRTDQPVDLAQRTAVDNAILLMDGVFLQRPELATLWDFRVWIEAPVDVTVQRAVTRDAHRLFERTAVQARYERRYVPGQMIYLAQCRPGESAHVVFDNADLENPDLLFQREV